MPVARFIRTSTVLLFLLIQMSITSAQELSALNTSIDKQHGFRFDFPADWIQKPPRANPYAIVKVSSNQSDRANCYVETREETTGMEIVEAMQERSSEYRVIAQGNTRLDSEAAQYIEIETVYSDFDSFIRIRNHIVWTQIRDQTLLINCGSFANHFEDVRPVFRRIIDSLRFIPPGDTQR